MNTPNPEYVEKMKEMVKNAPFPHHMNMQLVDIGVDKAEVELQLDRIHLQPFGIVHGGVLATLIDTATFWSAFIRIPEDCGLVNVDLKLNYLKPVVSGKLKAKGNCLKAGRTISYAEAEVVDENGELVAHGTSSLMIIPGKSLQVDLKKFISE